MLGGGLCAAGDARGCGPAVQQQGGLICLRAVHGAGGLLTPVGGHAGEGKEGSSQQAESAVQAQRALLWCFGGSVVRCFGEVQRTGAARLRAQPGRGPSRQCPQLRRREDRIPALAEASPPGVGPSPSQWLQAGQALQAAKAGSAEQCIVQTRCLLFRPCRCSTLQMPASRAAKSVRLQPTSAVCQVMAVGEQILALGTTLQRMQAAIEGSWIGSV